MRSGGGNGGLRIWHMVLPSTCQLAYLSDASLREKEEWREIEGETDSFCSTTMQVVR
jgi:hypothetical protein